MGHLLQAAGIFTALGMRKAMNGPHKHLRHQAQQLALLCLLSPAAVAESPANSLSGTVRSMSGAPIQGIRVVGLAQGTSEVFTDRYGYFSLPTAGRVLLFENDSYAPRFMEVGKSDSPLNVHLEDRASRELSVPACTGTLRPRTSPLRRLAFRLPRGLSAAKSVDVDYSLVSVFWKKSKGMYLRIWESTISTGLPSEQFFNGLVGNINTTPIDLDGTKGYDIRVKKATGRISRRFGVFYTYASYEDVPPETAERFDRVIDSFCHY